MSEKNCTKCGELKPYSEFNKENRGKHGIRGDCKICQNEIKLYKSRTKDGLLTKIYARQIRSSKQREHALPVYSVSEFKIFMLSKTEFHILFDGWVESNYDKCLVPTFDREDDYKGYSFDNFRRVCTFRDNNKRAHSDMRSGINNKQSKAVLQLTKEGILIAEYHSTSEAGRKTGASQSHISHCCMGRTGFKTAGGFVWCYA